MPLKNINFRNNNMETIKLHQSTCLRYKLVCSVSKTFFNQKQYALLQTRTEILIFLVSFRQLIAVLLVYLSWRVWLTQHFFSSKIMQNLKQIYKIVLSPISECASLNNLFITNYKLFLNKFISDINFTPWQFLSQM